MARLNGFGCSYCALPVRFTGDHRHPGYVVIDQVTPPRADPGGLPDLRVLHRFCSLPARAAGHRRCSSITLRRAWLGWATTEFEAGRGDRRYGIRHYPRLGLHPARLRRPELFRKYWRIRKMRCAALACRYYPRCDLLPTDAASGVA
ncbi:hypothetical protein [Amycolatopsis alkalitolerans]|uniref:Uncharacterized protein n=1 Tax=Amycolatopsis alkalitolerans TaxID=2547244 RepID=A0A5C4LTH5_9PSEU|nr:hypothetical protein [Amycolatopsis alkalitolerans]TNC21547.1 hypothetical protein FG385_27940 [Amycolatopsis alkalitolerans]